MPNQPKRRSSCLGKIILVIGILLFAEVYIQFVRPNLGSFVGQKVGQQFGLSQQDGNASVSATPREQQNSAQQPIQTQVAQTIPTAVAALPYGEIVVTEQRINEYFAANPEAIKPIERLSIRLVPDEMIVDMVALGSENRVSFGLAVENGRIVVVNPRLDGMLGLLVSFEDMTQTLETKMNDQLVAQGRQVKDIRIEEGRLVVLIE